VKKLPGIDWKTAYASMKNNAEVAPDNHHFVGRGGIEHWKTFGYLPQEVVDMPSSLHMEYAANDFAVATVAQGLGLAEDAALYFKRSQNWENLWNPELEADGFKGFIWTRHLDGSWKQPFNATKGCSWNGDTFYEGNSWTYSWFVPQDMRRLVEKCGGEKRFVDRLDCFFDTGKFRVNNEPGFLIPYSYLWAGRHDKTADRINNIIRYNFNSERNGIPGNDDSGAMSALFAFNAMGFFPMAGQDFYMIGTPIFSRSSIRLASGKTFTVQADGASETKRYVVKATLNGKLLKRAWFRHSELIRGGDLILTMAEKPGAWPDGPPPPSQSDPKQ
jgi:predicted alpha-1,2-mannosidase